MVRRVSRENEDRSDTGKPRQFSGAGSISVGDPAQRNPSMPPRNLHKSASLSKAVVHERSTAARLNQTENANAVSICVDPVDLADNQVGRPTRIYADSHA